jgi:cytoskeletal protein RodZ
MDDSIKKIGESLRGKRQEMSLSLKEVENITSIRLNCLKALEEGRLSEFSSPVYAKGFFQQYAAFLGLDPERLLKENPQLFPIAENQEFHYGIGTLESRATSNGGVKGMPNSLMIAGVVVVLFVAWLLARGLGLL